MLFPNTFTLPTILESAIAIGVGPRTVPDVVYHAVIVLILVWGLVVARRAETP